MHDAQARRVRPMYAIYCAIYCTLHTALAMLFTFSVLAAPVGANLPPALEAQEAIHASVSDAEEYKSDEILVVMKTTYGDDARTRSLPSFPSVDAAEVEELTANGSSAVLGLSLHEATNFHRIYRIRLRESDKQQVLETIHRLESDEHVLAAEPNYFMKLDTLPAPERTRRATRLASLSVEGAASAYAVSTNDPRSQWALAEIRAPIAWDTYSPDASAVRVGIIDSGVASHPDLDANVAHGWDFIHNNAVTSDDTVGHGTHVAGIVGAVGNNGIGISGIAHKVTLIPLQVFESSTTDIALIVKALTYATQRDIPIVNLSASSASASIALRIAISNYPGLVVCAPGNEAYDVDTKASYPTSFGLENVVSVAATSVSQKLASYSNYGGDTVHIAAPGEAIDSTHLNNAYRQMSGTSMAAPHVSGVAALILGNFSTLTPTQVRRAILESAIPLPALVGKVKTNGRLDAKAALDWAANSFGGPTGDTLSLLYDGNGATGGSPPARRSVTWGSITLVSDNTGGLSRAGARFAGWNSAKDGTGAAYVPGATVTVTQDITLYAQWLWVPTPETPQYLVTSATGHPGDDVVVYVSVLGNPGLSILSHSIHYDINALQLISIEPSGLFQGYVAPLFPSLSSLFTLRWTSAFDNADSGLLATLTFRIRTTAQAGRFDVSTTHLEARNAAGQRISVADAANIVRVTREAPGAIVGDVDGDGGVTDWDAILLGRYLAGWNVAINAATADVDGDGRVTDWDAILLERYLAGWNVSFSFFAP